MKIKELKKLIEHLPDNMLVVVSSDAEGNSYAPLHTISNEDDGFVYYPEDREIRSPDDLDEGEKMPPGGKKCIVIWPS